MSTELQTIEHNGVNDLPLTARDIRAQVNLVQEVMKEVMQGPTVINGKEVPGVHYGTVPGCGDKPTLLQPGAHKLLMTFRLVPDPEMTILQMERGHREVRCKVKLFNQRGVLLGAGVGTCSTMEGKYRFRKAEQKCPKCGKETIIKGRQEYGGGWLCYQKKGGCGAKFADGNPEIENQNMGRIEHDNPADYYNTVEKMAYKRALVSATLTVTAASDIFTQDIEDMPEVIAGAAAGTVQASAANAAPTQQSTPKDKGSDVLGKMRKPAAQPAAPAASEAHQGDASGPVTGGPAAGEQAGLDAAWLSEVLDCEDALRQTQAGKNLLRGIREGFKLEGSAYPMLPEHQVEYLTTLRRTVERMGKA